MIGDVYQFDDLRRISKLGENAQLATVERWAKSIGLKYTYDGRGGIWTTKDALNAVVGLTPGKPDDGAPYSPEMVACWMRCTSIGSPRRRYNASSK